jgi:peroxiredoxin Q/BCP
VLGCSPDAVEKQAKFKRKYNLTYPLLADVAHAVAGAYGVWQQKSFMGKKYMGVARTTFIVDEDGRIAHVFDKVRPEGHADEVAAALRRR